MNIPITMSAMMPIAGEKSNQPLAARPSPRLALSTPAASCSPPCGCSGRACIGLRAALSEIPAEVDLYAADLVAVEGQQLGVAQSLAVRLRRFVRDEDLVRARQLDQAREVVRRERTGRRPAALPVRRQVD